jgi:hypothetical protein
MRINILISSGMMATVQQIQMSSTIWQDGLFIVMSE